MEKKCENTSEINSLKARIKEIEKENEKLRQTLEAKTTEYDTNSMTIALVLAEDFDALNRAIEGDFSARANEETKNELLSKLGQMINKMIDANKEMLDGTMDQLKVTNEKLQTTQKTILEMSTPVIQIWEEVLVLPLVGVLDSARAQQAMEALLIQIVERKAKMVIIDITGVSMVDSAVANHLIKTCLAIKLIGAEVILTGISVGVVQILVSLGVDLSGITTRSSMSEGLKLSLKKIGLGVFSVKEKQA